MASELGDPKVLRSDKCEPNVTLSTWTCRRWNWATVIASNALSLAPCVRAGLRLPLEGGSSDHDSKNIPRSVCLKCGIQFDMNRPGSLQLVGNTSCSALCSQSLIEFWKISCRDGRGETGFATLLFVSSALFLAKFALHAAALQLKQTLNPDPGPVAFQS